MGRFKIKEDGVWRKTAWKDEVDSLAGNGRIAETVKGNADKIGSLDARLEENEQDLAQHKLDYIEERDEHLNSEMPHIIVDEDNDKTYFFGLRIKDGGTQFMYKEVMVND